MKLTQAQLKKELSKIRATVRKKFVELEGPKRQLMATVSDWEVEAIRSDEKLGLGITARILLRWRSDEPDAPKWKTERKYVNVSRSIF